MSRPISLFTDYSQLENRVTNYCGLFMKLIYEHSSRRFTELLDKLTQGQGELVVGPVFEQQQRGKDSVPDLVITQQSFTIAFETKLTDWFYDEQLVRHLQGLKQHKGGRLILFLLSNFEENPRQKFRLQIEQAAQEQILLIPLSYEDLLTSLEGVCITDYLKGLLDEFREFIDSKGLLPNWRYLLDVVNCATTMHEIQAGAYMCPDTGGAYRHRRARYLGAYAEKSVERIYEVDAVASVRANQDEITFKWINQLDADVAGLKSRVRTLVDQFRPDANRQVPLQVFLLGKWEVTKFKKDTIGGMRHSKLYFWLTTTDCQTVADLARKLDGKSWSQFRGEL